MSNSIIEPDPLDINVNQVETLSSGKIIPNRFPSIKNLPYRIAIIGEAPGADEEIQLRPFVGQSGKLLDNILSKAQIVREACFVGNIVQLRPFKNEIDRFSRDGREFREGLAQLKKDLDLFQPHICILLGKTALWAAKSTDFIGNWRGSIFIGSGEVFGGRKCIASYHPAACLRMFEWTQLLLFDIVKAKGNALNPQWAPPSRDLAVGLSFEDTIANLQRVLYEKPRVSIDIEGYVYWLPCLSIATSAGYSFIVPFTYLNGLSYWGDPMEELQIWSLLRQILMDSAISKVWQNGLYDRFVLQYGFGIPILGNTEDTMLKFWEKYCEMEKNLGFQCSVLTNEPYYKSERKSDDWRTHFTYCCRDSAVTYEIAEVLEKRLDPEQLSHYRFNNDVLNLLLYIELRGIKYDSHAAKLRLAEVNQHVWILQAELDYVSACGVSETTISSTRVRVCQEEMTWKKDVNKVKEKYVTLYPRALALAKKDVLSRAEVGEFNILCNCSMNVKSDKFKDYLYETLKLSPQYNTDPSTKKKSLTTDNEALLNLQKTKPTRQVELGIAIMELRTRAQTLEIHADPDGRIRCGYNLVGTVTGRVTSYTSPTGSGYNLQTIPDAWTIYPLGHPLRQGMRDLFQADEGYYLFQCDLKGSDGWTIGANLEALGDSRMIDDLRFGIKPAARSAYMLRHGNESLRGKPRDETKHLLKEISKEDWDYFTCKVGIWGICYLMGPDLLNAQIMEESLGKISLTKIQVIAFRESVYAAYGITSWHNYSKVRLTPPRIAEIRTGFGYNRRFYGRYTDVLGEFLAHEPQANTTYATNKAAHRLWSDPENRLYPDSTGYDELVKDSGLNTARVGCRLRIEPLHQVHDALVGQFRIKDTKWAIDKLRSYFENPIKIAGQMITIPFDGQYGMNWALDEKSKVGNI